MGGVAYDFLFLLNAIIVVLWALFLISVLRPRWGWKVSITGFSLCVCMALFAAFLMPYRLIQYRQLVGVVILISAALIFFSDKWTKVLFAVFMMYMDVLLCEILILPLLPNVSFSESWIAGLNAAEQTGLLLVYVFLLATLLFFTSFLFNRKTDRLRTKEWMLFSMFPVSQLLLLILLLMMTLGANARQTAIWQIITGLVCIGVDVGLFFAVHGMSQRAELAAQNRILADQIETQKQHYSALSDQYTQVRKMRHDIANHVHTVQLLLEKGDTQAAQAYAAEILDKHAFHSSLGECENPVVDAFIYDRMAKADRQQIPMHVSIRMPYRIGIPDSDLITVFGNLLDNAAEACLALPPENRQITLRAAMNGKYFSIHMENTCSMDNGGTHADHIKGLSRGLGQHILTDLAHTYHGNFSAQAADGIYRSDITLLADSTSL